MSRLFIILFVMVTCCCLASRPEVEGQVTSFGLFMFTTKPKISEAPGLPGGAQGSVPSLPVLVTATNHIPAKMGVRFGLTFEVTNLRVPDGIVEMTKVVRHPPIMGPDGKATHQYATVIRAAVHEGRATGWMGYGFDVDSELVKGDWNFELQFDGKMLCTQKFIVVEE